MNYDHLFKILPKTHWQWNIEDTKHWLTFIGLDSLKNKFQYCSIDGSILASLNEDDFKRQLQITSKIIIKKLMNWIIVGIPEFDQYVQKHAKTEQTNKINEVFMPSVTLMSKPSLKEEKQREIKNKARQMSMTEQPKRTEANQLIIKQLEQNQVGNYYLKQKGATIGRNSQNQIVILDQFVSRYHAQIIYEQERYYIKDMGSNSGTFIKIALKLLLNNGMIIEMGSNQFQVNLENGNLTMRVIDGPNKGSQFPLIGLQSYSIGRKQSNQMCFSDDQHLSGIHSKIFRIKQFWYIEDIATTNGTWLRLSRPDQESDQFLLQDKCQFKLSSNLIYECLLNINNRKTNKIAQQKCYFCKTEDKNSIIMPCKHAVGCYTCLIKQQKCPICQSFIQQVIKMFTA